MSWDLRRTFAVCMTMLMVSYWLVPDGLLPVLLSVLASVLATTALGYGISRDRSRRAAWALLTFGYGIGQVGHYTAIWDSLTLTSIPGRMDSAIGHFLDFVLTMAGLVVLQRSGNKSLTGLLDALVVTMAGGLLLWTVLATTAADRFNTAGSVQILYTFGDLLQVALLVWLATSQKPELPQSSTISLALAILFDLAADTVDQLHSGLLTPQTRDYGTLDLITATCMGFAAVSTPWKGQASRPGNALSVKRLFLAYVGLIAIPLTAVLADQRSVVLNSVVYVGVSTVLLLLVPARIALSLAEQQKLASQRDAYRANLAHQAAHDSLTGLPNRAYLLEQLTAVMHRAARTGDEVALLFVDLDYFKRVNDQLGHAAGDEVLRTTARRMKQSLRASDVVGRQGGDEFVILIEPVPALPELMEIAERLIDAVSEPIATAAGRACIGASVGIALARDAPTDAENLLQDADLAAYRAKSKGRGRAEIYDQALRAHLQKRTKLEGEIRAGLANGEFSLHYQPVLSVASGELHSYEALIRWQHPERGLIGPAEFIPTAEESLLICDIGRWVLARATRQLAEWTRTDPEVHAGVTVAVNVSARHLATKSLVDEVVQALLDSGLEASRLVLEITETVLLDEPTAETQLRALRALGVTVSLDDFGTGYTSIGQLRKLQVDTLKIDQSFLHSDDPATQALVRLIVTAAHAFKLSVIAEGVETREQLERLAAMGCELAQGFYLGRPAPAAPRTGDPGRRHQESRQSAGR